MKRLYAFVDNYKAILKIYENHPKTTQSWKHTLPIIVIITALSILMGYLFQVLTNLNYIWYMTIVVVLGSFLLYRIRGELQYKTKYGLTYNHWVVIGLNLLSLASIVFLSNIIVILLLLRFHFPVLDMIVLGVLSLVFVTIHTVISQTENMGVHTPYIARNTVVIVLLYYLLFQFVEGIPVAFAYPLFTGIISILFILRLQDFRLTGIQEVHRGFLAICGSILVILFIINPYERGQLTKTKTFETVPNIVETFTFDGREIQQVMTSEDYVYIFSGSYIWVYENNLEYLTTIHRSYTIPYQVQFDTIAYTELESEDTYDGYLYLYDIEEGRYQLEQINLGCYEPTEYFYFEREIATMCGDRITKFTYSYALDRIVKEDIERYPYDAVLYQDDNRIIITANDDELHQLYYVDSTGYSSSNLLSNDISRMFYSDGYILELRTDSNQAGSYNYGVVYLINELYEDEKDILFEIDQTFEDIEHMVHIGDYFYITMEDSNTEQELIGVYNEDGRLLSQYYTEPEKQILYLKTGLYMISEDDLELYKLDDTKPGLLVLGTSEQPYPVFYNVFAFVMIASSVIVSKVRGDSQ